MPDATKPGPSCKNLFAGREQSAVRKNVPLEANALQSRYISKQQTSNETEQALLEQWQLFFLVIERTGDAVESGRYFVAGALIPSAMGIPTCPFLSLCF